MPTSVNKGYELQVTGTNSNTWGDIINEDDLEIIDRNLGGSVTKSLTNVNVDLDAEESQNLRLILNGTLTGNVLVTTQCVGITVVENNCTGNFTVTFRHNSGGTPVTVPNNTVALVATAAGGASPKEVAREFPTGTRMAFQQTTPPAGWSKDTTTSGLNNSAMRLVTGTASSGGSSDFTTAFASRGLSGSVNNHQLTEAQMPSHRHYTVNQDDGGSTQVIGNSSFRICRFGSWGGSSSIRYDLTGSLTEADRGLSGASGSNESHNHGLTLNNLDMSVRYFDFSIGVRI